MPKKPMNYSKTIMYKLVCKDLDIKEIYVGHTTDFKSRKRRHKQTVENSNDKDYNSKKSTFIREHGGWSGWSMIQIELYPCDNLQEAIARERYWYEELRATLNSNVPSRSTKEYYEDNKEHLCKYSKEYYELNKEQIIKQGKEYREAHKQKALEQEKKYRDEHKDKIQEKNKKYREQHKEKIQANKATQYECECGSTIRKDSKVKHLKSVKHCQFLETNNI